MSADRFEFIESTALTADGAGGWIPIPVGSMLQVTVDLELVSGTTPLFSCWLQTDEGGTGIAFDMIADQVTELSSTKTENTINAPKRNICTDANTTGQKFIALYKHLAGDRFRMKWIISGTAPSFTVNARGITK